MNKRFFSVPFIFSTLTIAAMTFGVVGCGGSKDQSQEKKEDHSGGDHSKNQAPPVDQPKEKKPGGDQKDHSDSSDEDDGDSNKSVRTTKLTIPFEFQNSINQKYCSNPSPEGCSVGELKIDVPPTKKVLKVTFEAAHPVPLACDPTIPSYTGLKAKLKINGYTVPVSARYGDPVEGSLFEKVPAAQTVNLKKQITGKPMTITLSEFLYDNCRKRTKGQGYHPVYGWMNIPYGQGIYFGGCEISSVFTNHIVAGAVTIETDEE